VIRNQKYSIISFLPLVFYEQFKFFFNLYFLLVALSQFIPALKIGKSVYAHGCPSLTGTSLTGFIATYIAPLAFVLSVTMGKEAYDDFQRHVRDKEANSFRYLVLDRNIRLDTVDDPETHLGMALTRSIPAAAIKAGDLVVLEKNMRVPADMILLRTSEAGNHGTAVTAKAPRPTRDSELVDFNQAAEVPPETSIPQAEEEGGSCFVRTDQLDGETDWKLKIAVSKTQGFPNRELLSMRGELYGETSFPFHS
jgi:phospholipid-translocating ATPase